MHLRSQFVTTASLALSLAASPACMLDTDPDSPGGQEEVGEVASASQEVSVAGGVSWSGGPLKLGPTSTETCFLNGLTGSLIGNPKIGTSWPNWAGAEVYTSGGYWWVKARAGIGPGVMAHVKCVNIPHNPQLEFSVSDNLSSGSVPYKSNRRCFLRKVYATIGMDGHVWNSVGKTRVKIVKQGNNYTFDNYFHNVGGSQGFGRATAVCFDTPNAWPASWNFTFTAHTNSANNAKAYHLLRNYFPNGPAVKTANTACGLTGIEGRWISGSPNPLGWENGAKLLEIWGAWFLYVTNGRTVHVGCVR